MSGVWKTPAGRETVIAAYARMLERWPVAHEPRRIATGQGETFVISCGPPGGPALVLLHGAASNSAAWMGDVAAWSETFRVHAIDLIGDAGFSAPARPPLAGDGYAAWLDEVLEALGVGRTRFVGLSFGGWAALDFAARRPGRVEKLVLLSPGGVGRGKNVLLWAIPLLLLGPWGRRRMARLVGGPPPEASEKAAAMAGFIALINRHFVQRSQALPQISEEALRGMDFPMLAILGGRDVFIDAADARRRLEAFAPQATVRFLPEAAHYIPGQTQTVLEFLR